MKSICNVFYNFQPTSEEILSKFYRKFQIQDEVKYYPCVTLDDTQEMAARFQVALQGCAADKYVGKCEVKALHQVRSQE